jgi:Zn-dependent protease with chaperone function
MPRPQKFLCLFLLLLFGCGAQQGKLVWRVKDLALERRPVVELLGDQEKIVLRIPTRTIQEMTLAHFRISRAASVQSELYIVEGDEPNAFAGPDPRGQKLIAISLGMIKLIGADAYQYAALIAHETAHWAKGHIDAGQTRASTLNAIGTLVGVGLSAAGVPAAGIISGLGIDFIDASFNRDQEREADAQSIDYLLVSNYDPAAAVALQEKFATVDNRKARLSFLSSHPSGEERIQNLRTIIQSKTDRSKLANSP